MTLKVIGAIFGLAYPDCRVAEVGIHMVLRLNTSMLIDRDDVTADVILKLAWHGRWDDRLVVLCGKEGEVGWGVSIYTSLS
ncbi:hypothetical protein BHE74_00059701 [Ensete ventricosum]|nr:hypothetical protein BHE74_00059701 [Ensete ventricosum]